MSSTRRFIPILLAILAIGGNPKKIPPCLSQTLDSRIAAASAKSDSTPDIRRETFDIVWRTVKEKHFDPTFGGVNWDKVRQDYLTRLDAVKNDMELYTLLQQMLGELHESHFAIIPPENVLDNESREARGEIGVDIRAIEGQMVITRVKAGSSAEKAGLKPGFGLVRVGGAAVGAIIERVAKTKQSESLKPLYETRAVLSRVNGDPGTNVKILYQDGENEPHEITIERTEIKDEMSEAIGNFPAQFFEFEAKRLRGGIGYIRFSIFVPAIRERVVNAIRSMSNAPGIIFDLRGNPGGLGALASGIAGLLETSDTSLGKMQMRVGFQNFAVFHQPSPYRGRVVVLIDELSASTSEVMAAGLQAIHRATVVGTPSAGAALPSFFQKLPTGALFQYAIADFRTPDGTLIEGRGVHPNIVVKLSRSTLLRGEDSQLEGGIDQLLKPAAVLPGKRAA
ncbi:MAG TPA: S41 family peptidase [Blastocatellia bacterium]|nr:S41 family peptidase [Blastocatellia bacterium]